MKFFARSLVLVSAMAIGANSASAVVYGTAGAPVTTSRSVVISYAPEELRAMEYDRVIGEDDSPGTDNNNGNKSGGSCRDHFSGAAGAAAARSGSGAGGNRSGGGSGGNRSDRGNGGSGGSGGNRSGGSCPDRFSR